MKPRSSRHKTTTIAGILCMLAVASLFLIPVASAIPVNPSFTSTPLVTVQPMEEYNYTVICDDKLAVETANTSADWLVFTYVAGNLTIRGIPLDKDIGIYYVNLSATNSSGTCWQNFTIDVNYPDGYVEANTFTPSLAIALVIGIALIVFGLKDRRFHVLAGFVWIFIAIVVFPPFGAGWVIIGIAIGMILLIEGGLSFDENKEE